MKANNMYKNQRMHHTLLLFASHVFEGFLYGLDLLGDGGQHSLLQPVELIEAAPGSHLTQPHKDTTHGLEEKCSLVDNRKTCTCKGALKLEFCITYFMSFIIDTWKSKFSSQLKTNTNLPSWFPKAFTDSVLPVPAGPWRKQSDWNTCSNLQSLKLDILN